MFWARVTSYVLVSLIVPSTLLGMACICINILFDEGCLGESWFCTFQAEAVAELILLGPWVPCWPLRDTSPQDLQKGLHLQKCVRETRLPEGPSFSNEGGYMTQPRWWEFKTSQHVHIQKISRYRFTLLSWLKVEAVFIPSCVPDVIVLRLQYFL